MEANLPFGLIHLEDGGCFVVQAGQCKSSQAMLGRSL